MSMSALLQGTIEYLRSNITLLNTANSGLRGSDGKPPPTMGQIYYAVHPVRWYAGPLFGSANCCSDEMFDVGVTITMRTGRIPSSQMMSVGYLGVDPSDGSALSLPDDVGAIEPKMRQVISEISRGRYSILGNANTQLKSASDFLNSTFEATDVDTTDNRITLVVGDATFGRVNSITTVKYVEGDTGGVEGLTSGYTYEVKVISRTAADPDDTTETIEFLDADLTGAWDDGHQISLLPEGFIEPLVFSTVDTEPRIADEEWFTAEPGDVRAQGWAMTAQFGGARRLQHLLTME